MPKIPHHVEAQTLPIDEAVALVERGQASVHGQAKLVLGVVAAVVPARITGIALRHCPDLPPTIAERITNYRARNNAHWVLYRSALAGAAAQCGWRAHWFDPRRVADLASHAMGVKSLDDHFARVRRSAGPPWRQDHKLAMAAAIMAAQ